MSMRVLEEKEKHFSSSNNGEWKNDIEDRLDYLDKMMMDCWVLLFGIPTEENIENPRPTKLEMEILKVINEEEKKEKKRLSNEK
jgi:hypothetical protein